MHGIFTYIFHKSKPIVGKYSIHGAYGVGSFIRFYILPGGDHRRIFEPSKIRYYYRVWPGYPMCGRDHIELHVFLAKLGFNQWMFYIVLFKK